MRADRILTRAAELIAERGRQRDRPHGERSMGRAVRAFSALYAEAIAARGGVLSEAEGWAFMELLKKARGDDDDSLLDGVAYAALRAECVMIARNNREAVDMAGRPVSALFPCVAYRNELSGTWQCAECETGLGEFAPCAGFERHREATDAVRRPNLEGG